ncbi:MAG: ArsR/SmtB family transcription factor [Chloroflexota bacterium]
MATLEAIAAALSDPIRIRILDFVAGGRHAACCSPDNPDVPEGICACDVLVDIGIAPSKLAYHTKELRTAGLINETRRGKWVYYTLNEETLRSFVSEVSRRFLDSDCHGEVGGACCAVPAGAVGKSLGQAQPSKS